MNFGRVRHLHFVGVGGVGMCGLAELLHGEGLDVSGCDLAASETTERLTALGIAVAVGHDAAHLHEAQVVVVSSAVQSDLAEVRAAREQGIPVIRRAEMLGEVSRLRWTIAVAGTHGKTTTTSLTGFVLTRCDLDPTVVVGGRVHFLGAHARIGGSEYLVCEADEYDRSFLALQPVIAVLTTIEPEHLDTYGTAEAMEDAFVTFANSVPFYGAVVANIDDPGVRRLLPRFQRRVITYGTSPQADVQARAVELGRTGATARIVAHGTELGVLSVSLPGRHVLSNALATVAVTGELNVPFAEVSRAIAAFDGVARRFEIKGNRDGVTVIDDYAHHPTEVAATLQAARQAYPEARIVAVFQPHLFSRTEMFARQFGESLLGADVVIVPPIYPAREAPRPGVTHELVTEAARKCGHRRVLAVASLDEAVAALDRELRPGDLLLTLGAGNVYRVGTDWLAGGER